MYRPTLFLLLFLTSLLVTTLSAKSYSVSYDSNYAPFSFSQDGKAYGLFIDIWKLWAKKNNHQLKFIKAKDWDDALHMAKTSEVDFFLGTKPYEPWMKASSSYYKTATALFTRKLMDKQDIKTIAIIGDDYREELQIFFKNVKIVSFNNYFELFQALLSKKVDAIYDDSLAITYYAIENKYIHIIKKTSFFSTTSEVCAISAKEMNVKDFEKGFKTLNRMKLSNIEKNWIYAQNERYFENLKNHRDIVIKYVYDPDWKPFEYQDKMSKRHIGIIADILSLISTKTGIKFVPIPTNSWAESVKKVSDGEAQMFSAVPVTQTRKKFLNFTKHNIYTYPAVLISKNESTFMLEKDLRGKYIGVIKENSLGAWVKKQYPLGLFKEFGSVEEALKDLDEGKIDFFAINGVTALYYINIQDFKQFKIYSIMDYMFHLKVALRKDVSKDVISLIDKSLSEITQKDLSDIYHKWTSVKVKKELNIRLLLFILLCIIFLVLIFLFINKKLKNIVKMKTHELRELNESLEEKVNERTKELETINQDIKANIEYASLIQNAILPLSKDINNFFNDSFVLWSPKDIVGGDIYFFERLNEDEAFLFVVDCTGHGVSGAFVTMLTKAIEQQLLVELKNKTYTPSSILNYFNKTFKNLLHEESNSSVGFDAGVVYINKRTKLLKYSGAKIPLFYVENEKVQQLNADKQSIGYDHCKVIYEYKEHSLRLKDGMKFYLTSDGYVDQNGGKKSFPMGKNRFQELVRINQNYKFIEQKFMFMEQLKEYQQDEERSDDIVFIGFEV